MKHFHFAIATSMVVLFSSAAHATITVNGIGLAATVTSDFTIDQSFFSGTSVPTVPDPAMLEAKLTGIPGEAYSKNSINWSVNGSQTIFSFDMDHKAIGNPYSGLGEFAGFETFLEPLSFTADVDADYELSGYYNVTIATASISEIAQFVSLEDVTEDRTLLFSEENRIDSYIEESVSLTLGEQTFDGSLTGHLNAGHTYELTFWHGISHGVYLAGDVMSAVGNLTLKIGEVPEPSSLAICSVLGLVVLIRHRPVADGEAEVLTGR